MPDEIKEIQQADTETVKTEEQVSRETYLKVLDEAKKAKAKVREFEEAQKKLQEMEMEKKGEYQKLISQRDEELSKLRNEIIENKRREDDRRKMASILESVGGDVDPKWYSLIEYEDVTIDPDTGRIDELSRAKAVQKLKEKYPEIIRNKNVGKIPAENPQGGLPGSISRAEWLKLPAKDMKKWKFDQIKD